MRVSEPIQWGYRRVDGQMIVVAHSRGGDGTVATRRLITLADYAYVFNLIRGFPGRR